MNKRGAAWTLLQTGTILAGVMVALILIVIVYRVSSQAGAEAAFCAKDSAMLADAILSMPGNVQVVYSKERPDWYVRLDNASVMIFHSQPKPDDTSFYDYYFVPRKEIDVVGGDLPLSTLYFIKSKDNLMISNMPVFKEGFDD